MAVSDGPGRTGPRRIGSWIVLPLLLAVIGLPTGCGGSDETSEETITKAEWVAQANRICLEAGKTIAPQMNSTFRKRPPETEDLLSLFRNLSPLVRKAIDDIDAMPPPAGDEQQVAAIVEAGNESADRIEQAITDPGVRQALGDEGFFPELFEAFRAYGVEQCARQTNPVPTKEGPGGAGGTPAGA